MTDREYNECVNCHADNVFRFIVKNIRHEEDSKDIVQTAFEKMWKNRHVVEFEKSKSYLFTIAYNQMIDHLRKTKRLTFQNEFEENMTFQKPGNHNVLKTIQEALNKLGHLYKSLVMLKDYEGYSYEEIGRITGLNESQVKVYLHRARKILRNYLVSPENVI